MSMDDEETSAFAGFAISIILAVLGIAIFGGATRFESPAWAWGGAAFNGLWWLWFPPLRWLATRGLVLWTYRIARKWWVLWS